MREHVHIRVTFPGKTHRAYPKNGDGFVTSCGRWYLEAECVTTPVTCKRCQRWEKFFGEVEA